MSSACTSGTARTHNQWIKAGEASSQRSGPESAIAVGAAVAGCPPHIVRSKVRNRCRFGCRGVCALPVTRSSRVFIVTGSLPGRVRASPTFGEALLAFMRPLARSLWNSTSRQKSRIAPAILFPWPAFDSGRRTQDALKRRRTQDTFSPRKPVEQVATRFESSGMLR